MSDRGPDVDDLSGKVAVVTGGAAGIGRGIVEALLEEGARVVIADVEEPVLDVAVKELGRAGEVRGVVTDVSSPRRSRPWPTTCSAPRAPAICSSTTPGVTSGGGGRPWEQEANDWTWCFCVNVFGVANGMLSFVPRMIESGEPGVVVNTSSMDGGIAPVPYASVYASSKAAISCLTEALAHQLAAAGHRAAGRGLLPLGRTARHRPVDGAAQPARRAGPGHSPARRRRARPSRSSRRRWRPPGAPSR